MNPPNRRRLTRSLAAAAALAAPVLLSTPARADSGDRAGLVWTVEWASPVTSAGPNDFDEPPVLAGTAKYSLGKTSQVTYTITSTDDLPDRCGTFPLTDQATLAGTRFTIEPKLACNGTYAISVVAQSGTGLLAAHSQPLKAPFSVADPGRAPGDFTGVVQGSTRTVTVSWAADPDPDVVGYRVRRGGKVIAEVPATVRIHSDVTPGYGDFAYDVATLHWGAGGPGSTTVASPATAPLVAHVVAQAPPTPVTPTGSSGGGSGGSASHPSTTTTPAKAPASHPAGLLPPSASAHAVLPDRSDYRSGGTISSGSSSTPSTTVDDGYAERLPYQPGTARDAVDLAGPDRTKTVSRTVSVPGHKGVGLLVPIAVLVVLLAASLQVRSLVGRASALAAAEEPDTFADLADD